jgi:hypothetical protein
MCCANTKKSDTSLFLHTPTPRILLAKRDGWIELFSLFFEKKDTTVQYAHHTGTVYDPVSMPLAACPMGFNPPTTKPYSSLESHIHAHTLYID